ncbi:UPF0149 family protein [Limnohabitans sp.]|jgi:uncharacterized protein|uniref:UPF0149 family protein n=1 Tax=Limnohabitans sp. TaxID=1907725 RepID=UPI001B70AA85|nr:UPF0149 family protein [Limnohabitans sp.]MBP6221354.1 UPF0149 family protein [Limnohabitans sp.]
MNTTAGLEAEDFDTLDNILDDLRERFEETPQWEFCEGFMAALVCSRRAIPEDEWLPMLLGIDPDEAEGGSFADDAQRQQFMALWQRRFDEIKLALDTPVEALDDDKAYAPEVMDVRGAIASLPPEEREEIEDSEIPSFAQVWALGFMFAVENWADEWATPKDKDAAKWHDLSLEAIVALTEDDTDVPTLSALSEDGPPSVSEERLNAYGEALWAVYDLREIWRNIGPRVAQVIKAATPGRNDACSCGSGKKYKKCCGA